jgi:hypothetical protein
MRYLYIVHENSIHEKFSKPNYVSFIGICFIFLIFIISLSVNLIVLITNGWPKYKIFEMSKSDAGLCLISILGTYLSLIGISCGFYSLVLRQRGKLGNNKTHPENKVEANNVNGVEEEQSLSKISHFDEVSQLLSQ